MGTTEESASRRESNRPLASVNAGGALDLPTIEITSMNIERDEIDVSSHCHEPDPDWTETDSSGREHRWVHCADGTWTLPTLEWRVTDRWWCVDCHEYHESGAWFVPGTTEEIEPGYLAPKLEKTYIAGPLSWGGEFFAPPGKMPNATRRQRDLAFQGKTLRGEVVLKSLRGSREKGWTGEFVGCGPPTFE